MVRKVFYFNRFIRVFFKELKLNCLVGFVIVFRLEGLLYGVFLVIGILGGFYSNVYYWRF